MKKQLLLAVSLIIVLGMLTDTYAQTRKERREARRAEKEAEKLEEIKDEDPDKLNKSELRLQNEHLMERITDLEAQISDLKDQRAALEEENMALAEQNQELLMEVDKLKEEKANFTSDYQALAAEYESLKAENEQLRKSGGVAMGTLTEEQMSTCTMMEDKLQPNTSYRADGFWKWKYKGYGVQVYSFDNLCDAMAKAAEFDAYYNLWKVYIMVKEVEGEKIYSVVYGSLKNKVSAQVYLTNFKKIARNDAERNAFLVQHNVGPDEEEN